MPGGKAVKERIEQLIAEVPRLANDYERRGWLVAAQKAIQLVCPSSGDPYCEYSKRIVSYAAGSPGYWPGDAQMRQHIGDMTTLLKRLLEEIEGGLLTTIENHAIAATFDDFLDHGAEYLKHAGRTRPTSSRVLCLRTP